MFNVHHLFCGIIQIYVLLLRIVFKKLNISYKMEHFRKSVIVSFN